MADFSINEIQGMKKLLQEEHKDKWESIGSETAKNKMF